MGIHQESLADSHESSSPKLVTLVVLAYRQERFVRQAVEAALAQTYQPLEIILSDDGSPDNTYNVMAEVAAAYRGPHRIVLNRNPVNLGIAGHVNRVFELATGDWVGLAAGDDLSKPNRVQAAMQAIESASKSASEPVFGLFSGRDNIDANGDYLGSSRHNSQQSRSYRFSDMVVRLGGVGAGATYFYHRDVMKRFGPLDKSIISEDKILPLRASILGAVLFLPESLIQYRVLEQSLGEMARQDRWYKMHQQTERMDALWRMMAADVQLAAEQNFLTAEAAHWADKVFTQSRALLVSRSLAQQPWSAAKISALGRLGCALLRKPEAFRRKQVLGWLLEACGVDKWPLPARVRQAIPSANRG